MKDVYPCKGEKVWYQKRHLDHQSQPNGIVDTVDFDDQEVGVEFGDGDYEYLDLGDFVGNWRDIFGGCWYLADDRGLDLV